MDIGPGLESELRIARERVARHPGVAVFVADLAECEARARTVRTGDPWTDSSGRTFAADGSQVGGPTIPGTLENGPLWW